MDPATCTGCHQQHVTEWQGSAHAYAGDDPVFVAMNKRGQRETQGALGTFCVNCHAPMAVLDKQTQDGLNLDQLPAFYRGVTCYYCHNVDKVITDHNNGLILANDTKMRGPFSDPVKTNVHTSGYAALLDRDSTESSALCGSCHDIVTPHGDLLEATFAEWRASVFSQATGGQTCGQCHMQQSLTYQTIAQEPNMPLRRTHSHTFFGVDVPLSPNSLGQQDQINGVQAFLNSSLQSAVCVKTVNDGANFRVILDNVASGHGFTSGATQDRRLWIELIAYKDDKIIYQTGVVADGNSPDPKTDSDLWLLGSCARDANGVAAPMFWNAASHTSNTLPALTTFNTANPNFYKSHVVQRFPRDITQYIQPVPDKVTLRVRLQPMGFDFLDNLVNSGDLDPNIRAAVPTFDIGTTPILEWTAATANGSYVENGVSVSCFTQNNINFAADKQLGTDLGVCE